jgi:hypothetical protein
MSMGQGTANMNYLQSQKFNSLYGDTGLKAYWKFDESSGDIINVSQSAADLGSAADLQVNGATHGYSDTPYYFDNALEFDGVNDRATAGTSTSQFDFMHNTTAVFTFNVWCKRKEFDSTDECIFQTNNENSKNAVGVYMGYSITDGTMTYQITDGSSPTVVIGPSTTGITQNTNWHMFTYTYDYNAGSDEGNFYQDGSLIATFQKDASESSGNAENAGRFGSTNENSQYLNGYICEASLWNVILTQAQITTLFNGGLGTEIY